jgi:transposase InsO family protein
MKTMPQSTKEAKYRWIEPILNKNISIRGMTKVCPFSERTLKYWLSKYREDGIEGLENRSKRPKTSPRETSIRNKERIIELRKRTNLCAKKLHWRLKKEGLDIPVRTIGKIIKKEGLVRKYRTRKLKYQYIKVPLTKGELVEIDVKFVPDLIKDRRYYQFTAIDCASRWRYLKIYEECSNSSSVDFLEDLISIAPFRIRSIKTDNGSNFTNRYNGTYRTRDLSPTKLHVLDVCCAKHNILHYLIDPGKPAQNGKVERSHRSDQESFYDKGRFRNLRELERKLKLWNNEYNNLEHCSLDGLTPNEFLRLG